MTEQEIQKLIDKKLKGADMFQNPRNRNNRMIIEDLMNQMYYTGFNTAPNRPLPSSDVKVSELDGLPENKPLYKDSGLWQLRSDDMKDVIVQQRVNESNNDFLLRCKA